jgi:hypothetical protein
VFIDTGFSALVKDLIDYFPCFYRPSTVCNTVSKKNEMDRTCRMCGLDNKVVIMLN